ncbi:nicotinate phosphoribosyltransferase [Opitutus terrae]|uniref:Nicotinate phosphoribosyltransferase n=1 Tax=Opitutus terrae (strain DSM 11246 / JCM 15787 / PB90-1) TaxID=452637 RepID=B1ZMI9_OPITP|nr:nicotinate phosphoribosyltransferase [Opitutus terrae]ACB74334.1 nicotinate phosphoribosyltransferase [Opitutus terrae PB90-1]
MTLATRPCFHESPLLTDLYQLTMAYGYWKTGTAHKEAVFHLFFRKAPFKSGYTIAAGLADAITWLRNLRFGPQELSYLATLVGNDGKPLFEAAFLKYLRAFRFTGDVDAVPEGTVVFPNEPLLRIKGPIIEGQLAETALLNFINFQTLIATKAARICEAAQGEPVLEFGLRRAQGVDGALAASRSAYIGGCAATSNVLAGQVFGIPVKGTHAHSWVMSFDDEAEAFQAYAEAMPNNSVFLVDTYDTLEGVRRAVAAGRWLRDNGHEMVGIRLDSGDLAYLSIEARKILDEAGFPDAVIVASNDLDEHIIASLKQQGAKIGLWGVGTKLVTAYDQPALGGVYKLAATRVPGGEWEFKVKLSEQSIKISNPGILQARRFTKGGEFIGDMIFNEEAMPLNTRMIVDPADVTRRKVMPADAVADDLLVPVFRGGELVYAAPTLEDIRARAREQLDRLYGGTKRLLNPHEYPVGLEPGLFDLKTQLVFKNRKVA